MPNKQVAQNDLTKSVQACLEELVEVRGWSVERLARTLNVTSQTIRNWRSGAIDNPRMDGVMKLHVLVGRSFVINPQEPAAASSPGLTRAEVEAIVAQQLDLLLRRGLTVGIRETNWDGQEWRADPEAVKTITSNLPPAVAAKKGSRRRA